MKKSVTILLLVSGILLSLFSYAQNSLILKARIGDKYYRNMSYVQAIATYEDVLKADPENIAVLPNLANSYLKVYDTQKAENIFAVLVRQFPKDSNFVLSYAKLLAIHKKYNVSAYNFRLHAKLCPTDQRGLNFAQAYESNSLQKIQNNSIITLANFNSAYSDFSPVFYKSGLIFCSARKPKAVVQRTFDWDLSNFLDLYYIPDTSNIKAAPQIDTIAGKSKRRKIHYNDDDTRQTSNDTKTMAGFLSHRYIDTTGMFVTDALLINGFSKNVNSKYHEGPAVFNKKQDFMLFTRNNYNKGRTRKSQEGINKLNLYSAEKVGQEWKHVKALNINNNDYSIGHPALSPNDSILYFVSDMPGGIGGTDLYKSQRDEKGNWTTPVNLGRPINTEGNEQFPYFDREGTFYFSSDGHPGFGGLDIFRCTLPASEIENLGEPVNSAYDDFGIALDQTCKEGFISSNRRRGFNDDDIYKVSIPKPQPFIIRVVDSLTNELIAESNIMVISQENRDTIRTDSSTKGEFIAKLWDQHTYGLYASSDDYYPKHITSIANINQPVITIPLRKLPYGCIVAGTVTDKETKLPLAGARVWIYDFAKKDTVYSIVTGTDGKYRYIGLESMNQYQLRAIKKGYFKKPPIKLSTNDNKCLSSKEREYDYLRDFELEEIVIGKAIKIDNIYFDLGKYTIRKTAAVELDKIVKLMQDNPDIVIELSSHTDCRASFKYNMTLSDNRAKASADYIISKGIQKERIVGIGYGETKLVNDCGCEGTKITRVCSEDEHQANRRTEFQVTGFLNEENTEILNDGKSLPPPTEPISNPVDDKK